MTYFQGQEDYNTRRPFCVVYPSQNGVDIDKQYSTRKAANNARLRACFSALVMTVTQVKKARAAEAERQQLPAYPEYQS